jgi:type III pantothenate kinase
MLLAIDVGNTSVVLGVFEGERLRAVWRMNSTPTRTVDEYAALLMTLLTMDHLTPDDIDSAAITCVVPALDPVFEEICRRFFKVSPLVVGVGIRTGLRILYDNPRDVGADRVVGAVAAVHMYGPPPLIVADLGTGAVFDVVSREGDYIGGAIAPGLGLSAEALFQRAARLYRVEFEYPQSAIGRNTVAAMQSGIVLGHVGLVESMIARIRKELGEDAKVIATGGWASLVARGTKAIDIIDPNLVLHGLRILYEMNRGSQTGGHHAQ